MVNFKVIDIRKPDVFPNLDYRFSDMEVSKRQVTLKRDFLGENPLHYYIDMADRKLIVANNICDIKDWLEKSKRAFVWERIRAVSNNTKVIINDSAFSSTSPLEMELGPTLQGMPSPKLDYSNLDIIGRRIRALLQSSLKKRLATIPQPKIGLLLSGGLDSMTVGYFLSKAKNKEITAYTLKVGENDKDVVKSRQIAKELEIRLTEVKLVCSNDKIRIIAEKYDSRRNLVSRKKIEDISLEKAANESLNLSGNPKKDNALCAIAMYLIGKAIQKDRIKVVFCGEGPNEMINDYGYNPQEFGYKSHNKDDIYFREALTFGFKKNDRQLGRGGLPKHAIARMSKVFSHYGIRLEAPYFNAKIAKIMTHIPHIGGYGTVKQGLVSKILRNERFEPLIKGTSKEKFQDGSGVSALFESFTQLKLVNIFEDIYGIRKTSYIAV